ncbi:MAG: hypothetical protein LUF87_03680 [Alistipes sp.]|nr:hypothetical protein [Alistipes sp.]
MAGEKITDTGSDHLTRAQVEELVNEKLGTLKIYIAESEITAAQENARAMVELAEF